MLNSQVVVRHLAPHSARRGCLPQLERTVVRDGHQLLVGDLGHLVHARLVLIDGRQLSKLDSVALDVLQWQKTVDE